VRWDVLYLKPDLEPKGGEEGSRLPSLAPNHEGELRTWRELSMQHPISDLPLLEH
jgi:hypothetical protein